VTNKLYKNKFLKKERIFKNMNKKDLVKAIAEKVGMTQKDVALVVDALPEVIKEGVVAGEKVALSGFLTFTKKHVEAKTGTTKLGGVEKEWSTPAKDEVAVKISKIYKAID
jgi:DNA-binding protein HU-beta